MKTKKLDSKKILKDIEKREKNIRKYGVKKIGIFGSFIKNQQKKKSDLDIIVNLENPTFDSYMELKFMLEKLFGRKIGLVIEGDLKPKLKHVKKEVKYVKI